MFYLYKIIKKKKKKNEKAKTLIGNDKQTKKLRGGNIGSITRIERGGRPRVNKDNNKTINQRRKTRP